MAAVKKRCAIYTRKSVDEGLDMEFNSLDAQRLAGENYIASQAANGWVCLPERYDDGGFSGGTLDRPALTRLLKDAESGLVDIIVVYKIDRLSRSISDFAELSKNLDKWSVSFCSVTQELNTSTSSGRMMLNILLTFAQFEREVIAERIRDKVAASRMRGQWMGGTVPFGYRAENRHLVPDPDTEHLVPKIFEKFTEWGSARAVAGWLNEIEVTTRQGNIWTTAHIYRLLSNYTYKGEVFYKGVIYPGEHKGLVSLELWDKAQEVLKENSPVARGTKYNSRQSPLKGLIRCGHCDGAMVPAYSKRRGRQYCYYVCAKDTKRAVHICPVRRIPAGGIEKAVMEQIGILFRSPSFVALVARLIGNDTSSVMEALHDVDGLWDELFPVEKNRLLGLIVESVLVYESGLEIKVKTAGMRGLVKEVMSVQD